MCGASHAQDKVRLGFLTDMSSQYADGDGKGGVLAIQMAIDDFGGKLLGKPIELLSADHQNKADIASTKAREWVDTQNVQLLIAGTNTATGLAMGQVANEKKRVMLINGAYSSSITGPGCSPYWVHYNSDTTAIARGTGKAVSEQGIKSWALLVADYTFGHTLEADLTKVINANGGQVVKSVRAPFHANDFSSYLMQVQSSKAQILGLANAGGDFMNSLKAAKEFGVTPKMKTVALMVFANEVESLGLKNAGGLMFTDSWFWDRTPEARKWTDRYYSKTGKMPTSIHASDYSSAMTYFKAVEKAQTLDADKVMTTLKSMDLNDMFGKGRIQPNGRYVHDMYLLQVKTPEESKGKHDSFKLIKELPGDTLFASKEEANCPLWK
ncbi:MAG: ABC transporter substrate-binding protein [Comamonas sp.]